MCREIYADHAATTPLDADALKLMTEIQAKYFANPSSAYRLSKPLRELLQESRKKIAACIGAAPDEIFFTSGGTEGNNWAIKKALPLNQRPLNVVTSAVEHKSVLESCRALNEELGVSVTKLPVEKSGAVDATKLAASIVPATALVSVMLANNEIGTIQPVKALAEISHERGKIFHTDAVQAVGHIPIDVRDLGVDLLTASAHKFNGPKGAGFLFAKAGVNLRPLLDGGAQEFGRRAGTENVATIAAMALALEKTCATMREDSARLAAYTEMLVAKLREAGVDFVTNGGGLRLPGHLSLSFRDCEGEMLMHRLDLKRIYVSTGSACNSRTLEISHVLRALKLAPTYARGTIRITFGRENREEDVDAIATAITSILA